ncbi:MAG: hypothetical protein PVJ49_13045 [Acidobacteriota bacterium]|jgi:hypothetical protein
MINVALTLLLLISSTAAWQAPSEEAEVLLVVQRFFDSMTAADPEAAAATLLPEGQFVSVRPGPDGAVVRTVRHANYLADMQPDGPRLEERMWEPQVLIHDRMALVWTPYDFHRDGRLSHCGIDAFSLIKTDAGWRIAGITYTVEPEGCAALGQPPRDGAR